MVGNLPKARHSRIEAALPTETVRLIVPPAIPARRARQLYTL
jgi:hypothetical protein